MLENTTGLVTGSSRGIGHGAARALLEHGAKGVVLTSEHSPTQLSAETRQTLELPGAHYIQADLTKDADIARLMEESWSLLGSLDVLINNAGAFSEPSFLEIKRADFDKIFHLNVLPALLLTQEYVRRRLGEGLGGRILFSTSLNGTRSEPGHTLYDASKSAVNGLIRQIAVEYGSQGFTTVGIAPGLVETAATDFGLQSDPPARRAIEAQIPVGKIATVDDVAQLYAFLSSKGSHYITGTIINIDGGLDAQQMSLRPIAEGERR